MKRLFADAAADWLTWFGTVLLVVAALLVIAAIIFTRGVDDLARSAAIAAMLALPGLVAIFVGRIGRFGRDQ